MAFVESVPRKNPSTVRKHVVIYTSAWGEEFEATVDRVNSMDERILYLKVPQLGSGEIMTTCENVRAKVPAQSQLEKAVQAEKGEM